jgi:hypothetical protein
MPTVVVRQDWTVTPMVVAQQGFPRRKRRPTWHHWRDQKGQIHKYFLETIIIKILNKKGLKINKNPVSEGYNGD